MIFALLLGCATETKIEQKPTEIVDECKEENLVSESAKDITDTQKETAIIIEKNFNNLHIPKNITAAAIVNGIVESGLEPEIIGDNGNSVGVFQLNENGLGSNMTIQHRQDININSAVVAIEILKNEKLLQKEKSGASIAELAQMFAERIMRPKDIEHQKLLRARIARKMFPDKIKEKCITL